MDDVLNRFARELADAIAEAVGESPQVAACRERARQAGYIMKINLEAVVGFGPTVPERPTAEPSPFPHRKPYDMTVNDRRFLRSLRISGIDEVTHRADEKPQT